MNTELLKSAVAAIFRRKGKKHITEEEFIFAASMEIRWYTPNEAKTFLKNARRYGMVQNTGEGLSPTFDLDDADLKQVIKRPEGLTEDSVNPLADMVEAISNSTGMSKSEILAKVNRLKRDMNIETQAAAVLVAAQLGVDVSILAQEALDELISSYSN